MTEEWDDPELNPPGLVSRLVAALAVLAGVVLFAFILFAPLVVYAFGVIGFEVAIIWAVLHANYLGINQ